MSDNLGERLNRILPRITEDAFLSCKGIGNETPYYIFDYDAAHEPRVREHLAQMIDRLDNRYAHLKVLHLNLLDVICNYLKQRGFFQKVLDMGRLKGDAAVLRALEGPLSADRLCRFIEQTYQPSAHDLLLISGVGSVWPMLRAHNLLNGLAAMTADTPLLLFYPGVFDGITLRLFGLDATNPPKSTPAPYYRAFILVPGGPRS